MAHMPLCRVGTGRRGLGFKLVEGTGDLKSIYKNGLLDSFERLLANYLRHA